MQFYSVRTREMFSFQKITDTRRVACQIVNHYDDLFVWLKYLNHLYRIIISCVFNHKF